MTCIVGLEHQGKVYIGGDSAGVAGWQLQVRADSKVFTLPRTPLNVLDLLAGDTGRWAMGFTTSFRMGQLLRYAVELPDVPKDEDELERFMVTEFVEAVRNALRDGGWLSKEHDRESGGDFLVGVRGRLFAIGSDFQVASVVDGYAAVGCGAELALGALHATAAGAALPGHRVEAALTAAAHHSAGVAPPFLVVSA